MKESTNGRIWPPNAWFHSAKPSYTDTSLWSTAIKLQLHYLRVASFSVSSKLHFFCVTPGPASRGFLSLPTSMSHHERMPFA